MLTWLLLPLVLAAVPQTGGGPPPRGPAEAVSRADTERLVVTHAATRWKVPEADVRVVESADRTWPDAGLGCTARRGVLGSTPTPGFRIVVAAGARRQVYHTDTRGRVRPCAEPPKPLGPIR